MSAKGIRVYGQSCIETLHESRKRKSIGLFVRISTFTYCIYPRDKTKSMFRKDLSEMALRSVLLIRIGKQNVEFLHK